LQEFEDIFDLDLDEDTGLYLLDSDLHENLLSSNPNITFTLANQKIGGPTVNIVLPYASFDLNVSAPIYQNGTSFYFPLRRADNDSQYTLGRTFLQEAYVTADYNTRMFNVSQCVFEQSQAANIVAITSTTSASTTPSNNVPGNNNGKNHALTGGIIVRIIVSIIAGLMLIAEILIYCLRRHHKNKTSNPIHEIDSRKHAPSPSAYAQ
jgi:hypothetical protein